MRMRLISPPSAHASAPSHIPWKELPVSSRLHTHAGCDVQSLPAPPSRCQPHRSRTLPQSTTVSSGSLEAPCSLSCANASLVRLAAAGRAEGSRRRGKRTSALAAAHSRCHAHSRRDTPSAPITLSGVARASSCRHEGHTKWLPLRPRQRWARRSRARLRDDGGTDDLRHAAHLCHLRG